MPMAGCDKVSKVRSHIYYGVVDWYNIFNYSEGMGNSVAQLASAARCKIRKFGFKSLLYTPKFFTYDWVMINDAHYTYSLFKML